MKRSLLAAGILAAVAALAWLLLPHGNPPTPFPTAAATPPELVTVRISAIYDGPSPTPKRLPLEADPFCARTPHVDESLVVHGNGALENVVVRLRGGPAGLAPDSAPVVVSQDGCMYRPRVSIAVPGQEITIQSLDETTHNVHAWDADRNLFNRAELKGQTITKDLSELHLESGILTLRCDIHPWMTGYVAVSASRSSAGVTGPDGATTLRVPVGQWTLEAWHETLGTTTAGLSVASGQTPAQAVVHFRPR